MTVQNSKKGFTLVELLVVIAIIGILIGMLLPAVQQVREAARRTQCLNGLRQIGLGTMNYESANMKFPTAGVQSGGFEAGGITRSNLGTENWGWAFTILPFIEQNNVFDERRDAEDPAFAIASLANGVGGRYINRHEIPLYNCPSRGGSRKSTNGVSLGDYCGLMASLSPLTPQNSNTAENGNFASDPDTAFNSAAGASTITPSEKTRIWLGIISKGGDYTTGNNVNKYSRVGFGSISDGSSNTMMYAEKSVYSRNQTVGSGGATVGNADLEIGYYGNASWENMRGANLTNKGMGNSAVWADNDDTRFGPVDSSGNAQTGIEVSIGSPHSGNVNCVLGDGSTHSVSSDTQLQELDYVIRRNDGSTVDITDL